MPKGKPIPNMMENEYFEFVYHCLKNNEGSINFTGVAVSTGLKDASAAKARLHSVMKAQEKAGPHQKKQQAAAKSIKKKVTAAGGKDDKATKKRKLDEVDEDDDEGEDDSESDLPNEKASKVGEAAQDLGDGENEI